MIDPDTFDNRVISLPVADIVAKIDGEKLVQQHNYTVIPTADDQNDFMISIRANSLRKWRAKLGQISVINFPWAEILLAIAAIIIGATLSAIISGVELDSIKGIFFYVVLPPIGAASFISQIFIRSSSTAKSSQIARDLIEEIPDPHTTAKERQTNESK